MRIAKLFDFDWTSFLKIQHCDKTKITKLKRQGP